MRSKLFLYALGISSLVTCSSPLVCLPAAGIGNTVKIVPKARDIKMIALNVDGVMTTGQVIYSSTGDESRMYCTKDFEGIAEAQKNGIIVILLSKSTQELAEKVTKRLGIKFFLQPDSQKASTLRDFALSQGISAEQIAYMGDDTPDIPCLNSVGLPACPQDASLEVKKMCVYIAQKDSGRGAVREFIEAILRAKQISSKQQDL
jgi:3-deoxy-D-manno-octulosonate 8-phosphate phosphatase (KDO 8-P phosphatase)